MWGKPAALDLESKFTEAGLGNVQVSDFRNFAHGRHNWIAKHGKTSGLIALVTEEDKEIAERTLDLIPREAKRMIVQSKAPAPVAALSLLVQVMNLVGKAAELKEIDPARPHVADFGRRLYHLKIGTILKDNPFRSQDPQYAAIERKSGSPYGRLSEQERAYWTSAYRSFTSSLENDLFGGIVLDYDGPICETRRRFEGPDAEVAKLLTDLLNRDLVIGIATGRGKSVANDMRKIIPSSFWPRVMVGYYNGSDIAALTDTKHPNKDSATDLTLSKIGSAIEEDEILRTGTKIECRPKQITIQPIGRQTAEQIIISIQLLIQRLGITDVRVFSSEHSVDVVAKGVSKRDLVESVIERLIALGRKSEVLSIGDRGKWPGNDFELLNGPATLSVNSVSTSPESCWNLAPRGHRNTQATIDYLSKLKTEGGAVRFHQ
jgi:hydroxymethylpyrimidine pyrophosphatase-like HAD family hydrolase